MPQKKIMKNILLLLLGNLTGIMFLYAQNNVPNDQQRKAITALIDQYAQAREKKDTTLLKTILTDDIDQLVSTGEWRNGMSESVKGMMRSSASTPGTRTLNVEKIRMLNSNIAIVDCRYEIQNTNGTSRKMWSTFIVVFKNENWKISAIRNMLPAANS
jgi:uncharacterized protein (TIGR02246 family)